MDSLFSSIPLEQTINICTESIYDQNDSVQGLNKSGFKELLSFAISKSYFIFDEFLYKQIDSVAMGSPLGLTLANSFLCFQENKWLQQYPQEFKLVYYTRYVDGIFVLFRSCDHLIKFRDYLNKCYLDIKFSFEEGKMESCLFLM